MTYIRYGVCLSLCILVLRLHDDAEVLWEGPHDPIFLVECDYGTFFVCLDVHLVYGHD